MRAGTCVSREGKASAVYDESHVLDSEMYF